MRHLTQRYAHAIPAGALDYLTDLQHLHPHRPLRQCLIGSAKRLGIAPDELDRSLAWLSLDPARAIGRLRRTELMQLAHHLERRRDTADIQSSPPAPLRSAQSCGRS